MSNLKELQKFSNLLLTLGNPVKTAKNIEIFNLIVMGWALGMATAAVILRYGHQAEALAWAVPFLVQPVSAVFYPVSVLPNWLQPISYLVPATYVFEGMRHLLAGDQHVQDFLCKASCLNLVYASVSIVLLGIMLANARERGSLAKLVS